jgi:putative transposase
VTGKAWKGPEDQEEHHRSRTFQEEYREFLRKHGVEYAERYVWD